MASTLLHPVDLLEKPRSNLAIDIVGSFEQAPCDCSYMITLVDYFSKWPDVLCTTSVKMTTVVNFRSDLFAREGFTDELGTDYDHSLSCINLKTF